MISPGEDSMTMFIIMTSSEADIVRGSISTTAPYYMPIRRANDMYILPISILTKPQHEQWWEFLGDLPKLDHSDPNFPGPYVPPE